MPEIPAIAVSIALTSASIALQDTFSNVPNRLPAVLQLAPEASANEARDLVVRQPLPPRRMVFGNCRVGGAVFFEDNVNPYLYIGCALSDGICEAIDAVYYGGMPVPLAPESPAGQAAAGAGSVFYSNFNLSYRLGTATQTADPLLSEVTTLPANFWQRGVCCAAVRMYWGDDAAEHSTVWGQGVAPSFQGRFLKVYDPREVSHDIDDPTTWDYTENPALCVAHAMRFAWGVGLSSDYIDWDSVADAADACDATTTYDGDTVPLFVLAGVFQSDTDIASQISDMLASFRGVITYSDGLYKIKADTARTSVWTITDDDILEFIDYTHAAGRAESYSAIKATYFDKDDAGRGGSTPVYEDAAAVAADGLRETAISVPFCAAEHSAQILVYRKLQEIRNGRRLTLRVSDAASALDAFELVTVDSAAVAQVAGTWQIDQIDVADAGFILSLREYVPALYDDPTGYLV